MGANGGIKNTGHLLQQRLHQAMHSRMEAAPKLCLSAVEFTLAVHNVVVHDGVVENVQSDQRWICTLESPGTNSGYLDRGKYFVSEENDPDANLNKIAVCVDFDLNTPPPRE